jgi:methionyl-tRNA formyltransferase
MTKTLPIIFFGSSDFSVYVLKEFLKKYKPVLVLTLKAKPQGRGLKIQPNIVYSFCLKEKLSVVEFESWGKFKEDIEKIKPSAGIVAGFGKIIPLEIINLFPKGNINVHPSLLPKYRGPNPIGEVILNGEKETGVTLFLIDELVDHGPIIKQEKINLIEKENYVELEQILGRLGGKMLNEIFDNYLNGKTKLAPQDENLATYTKKITKKDGLLSFSDVYEIWNRKIRALDPWPGTYVYLESQITHTEQRGKGTQKDEEKQEQKKILKIFSITKLEEKNLPKEILKKNVGEFFELKNDLGLKIKDAFIILNEVQLEGRKKMTGKEFLNGFRKLLI